MFIKSKDTLITDYHRRGAGLFHRNAGPVIISRYRLDDAVPSANWRFNSSGSSWWPSCSSLAMVSNSISRGVMASLPAGGDQHCFAHQEILQWLAPLCVKPSGYALSYHPVIGPVTNSRHPSHRAGEYLASGQCKADRRSSVRSLSYRNR